MAIENIKYSLYSKMYELLPVINFCFLSRSLCILLRLTVRLQNAGFTMQCTVGDGRFQPSSIPKP